MRDNLIKISATRVPNFEKKKRKAEARNKEKKEKRNSDEDKPNILILHPN